MLIKIAGGWSARGPARGWKQLFRFVGPDSPRQSVSQVQEQLRTRTILVLVLVPDTHHVVDGVRGTPREGWR